MAHAIIDPDKPKTEPINDVCDVCGYAAYVRIKKNDHELTFCGHHFAVNESLLRDWSDSIEDTRELLLV